MKKLFFLIILCMPMVECGGPARISNSDSADLNAVPDESPVEWLIGDWDLVLTVSHNNCSGKGSEYVELEEGDYYDGVGIRVSASDCSLAVGDNIAVEEDVTATCKVGASRIIVKYEQVFDEVDDDDDIHCEIAASHNLDLEYNEKTDTISGTFSSTVSVSGICKLYKEVKSDGGLTTGEFAVESVDINCKATGDVESQEITVPDFNFLRKQF